MSSIAVFLFYYALVFNLQYYYFCRMCRAKFHWYGFFLYTVLSWILVISKSREWIGTFPYVLVEILILACCGKILMKCKFRESLVFSSVVITSYSAVAGIFQSLTFWVVAGTRFNSVLKYADYIQMAVVIIVMMLIYHGIEMFLIMDVKEINLSVLTVLIIPMLFITFVEAYLSDSVYGSYVVWDTDAGLLYPVIDHIQMLSVRFLAFGGLFSILAAYRKLIISIDREQTVKLLEHQIKSQKIYIREARLRYERNSAFRHDLKNHLLVLNQLLKEGRTKEAHLYLEKLENVSGELSFPVKTGNIAVDALMSSKLTVAVQKGITVECSMMIPNETGITDMEWCIIISNGLDNAINAAESIGELAKTIHITGRQKGNLYMLSIDNSCPNNMDTPIPGTGLSNIKAVLHKYNGKMDIEIIDGTFRLSVLLIIPQHSEDIPQQIY